MNLFNSITSIELHDALKQMKRGKTPGLDGISFFYLYRYLTLLLDIFQEVIREAGFHRDVNTAITTLLL